MKAVMIIFNQTHSERVDYMLDELGIRGYTKWEDVKGRGSDTGEPRMGTHTWPEMNSGVLAIVKTDQVEKLLHGVRALDRINASIGVKAFVWPIEEVV